MKAVVSLLAPAALVGVKFLEWGFLPDVITRFIIRLLLRFYLWKLNAGGSVERKMMYKQKFVHKLRAAEVAVETAAANEQHYEVPTSFYLLSLGERLKYSSCIWPDGAQNWTPRRPPNIDALAAAENSSLALICERAAIKDGMTVLDLGCGWGSLTLYVAEHFPSCRILAVSNSRTQRKHIERQAQARGFDDRVRVRTEDANTLDLDERFDRVISIEMLEHMQNYRTLFHRVASWLQPNGRLFAQILCHREHAYSMTARQDDWMGRTFFTGGTMPSADLFLYFQEDLVVDNQWSIDGRHYSKTLDAWLALMDANAPQVRKVFSDTYGDAKARQKVVDWRTFYIFCSESFGLAGGNEWMVAHYTFRRRDGTPEHQ